MTPRDAATTAPDVVIVDDHALLAQSLATILGDTGITTSARVPDEHACAREIVDPTPPRIVLLDLFLGARIGASITWIAELARHTRVVMLTGVSDRIRLAECLEAGAAGIIDKTQPITDVIERVRAAVEGLPLIDPYERTELLLELRRHRAAERARLARFDQLTPRERQVLAALNDGHSADQIAKRFVVSLATVRTQIRSVLLKLDVNSQLSAVALAHHARWTPDAHAGVSDRTTAAERQTI